MRSPALVLAVIGLALIAAGLISMAAAEYIAWRRDRRRTW